MFRVYFHTWKNTCLGCFLKVVLRGWYPPWNTSGPPGKLTSEDTGLVYYYRNYVFPQCAELAERLEEGDIFPPVEEIVCPLLFGAALHIQVTIIMVRCVFCHLGDFLSNWVAWSLCLSMDYSLAYCALFCTAFPVSYYNLLSSCVVMVGQFSYSILLHVTISSTLVILNV